MMTPMEAGMKNEATMENLQKALQMELTAAHQYQLHAHVLDDWGLTARVRDDVESASHSK